MSSCQPWSLSIACGERPPFGLTPKRSGSMARQHTLYPVPSANTAKVVRALSSPRVTPQSHSPDRQGPWIGQKVLFCERTPLVAAPISPRYFCCVALSGRGYPAFRLCYSRFTFSGPFLGPNSHCGGGLGRRGEASPGRRGPGEGPDGRVGPVRPHPPCQLRGERGLRRPRPPTIVREIGVCNMS
jgi:hypothetical protein